MICMDSTDLREWRIRILSTLALLLYTGIHASLKTPGVISFPRTPAQVYLVFSNTKDAGVFALLLRDLVTTNQYDILYFTMSPHAMYGNHVLPLTWVSYLSARRWEMVGLPEDFSIRISLHTGSVRRFWIHRVDVCLYLTARRRWCGMLSW